MDERPLTVCAAADERYRLGLVVTLFSALEKLSRPARVYVLDSGLNEPTAIQRLLASHPRCASSAIVNGRLDAIGRAYRVAGFSRSDAQVARYGDATWLRLFLADLLPEVDRIIYLDSDVLVRADLAPLWAVNPDGAAVAAVRDYLFPTFETGLPSCAGEEWFSPGLPYFNAGVLLQDLSLWRGEDVGSRVVEHLKRHMDSLRYVDQDVLNSVLAGQIYELDPRWNVQEIIVGKAAMKYGVQHGLRFTDSDLKREARMVHFTGRKPWQSEALRASRWSIQLHLEFARTARRFAGMTPREQVAGTLGWMAGMGPRTIAAVRKRVPARAARHGDRCP